MTNIGDLVNYFNKELEHRQGFVLSVFWPKNFSLPNPSEQKELQKYFPDFYVRFYLNRRDGAFLNFVRKQ